MSSGVRQRGGNEPWRNRERHYCAICNSWMGSDRQSILLHENGKKHKEKLQESLEKKRNDRLAEEKQAQHIQVSLKGMEAAALQAHVHDLGHFAAPQQQPQPQQEQQLPGPATTTTIPSSANHAAADSAPGNSYKRHLKQEKKEWEARKKHRQEEKAKVGSDDDNGEDAKEKSKKHNKKRKIGENEGFYTLGKVSIKKEEQGADDSGPASSSSTATTYLEGVVFGDLLEEDLPIQIWTGSHSATPAEQRLVQYHHLWLDAIVAAVRRRMFAEKHEDRLVVDVAYLKQTNDEDETLEKSVPLSRIRIVLGARDTRIPATLEEARIMAMGGDEQETVIKNEPVQLDEATGLSKWSTVSVKRTTVQQELREERDRLRQARKEKAAKEAQQEKEAQFRRMEEAKVANADDSALGAYDVWNTSSVGGYKGVDIHSELTVPVEGKKLATSDGATAFKNSTFKAKAKKQNRRTTSADDD